MLKIGDKVRKKDGKAFIYGNHTVDIVKEIDKGGCIALEKAQGCFTECCLELAEPKNILRNKVHVKVAKAHPNATIPKYQTDLSAGFDIHAVVDVEMVKETTIDDNRSSVNIFRAVAIQPNERKLIKTGLRIAVPEGYELQLRPRSGLALKHGISLTNSPATIDADYTGEIGVILENRGEQPFIVEHGDRICQGVIAEAPQALFEEVEDLDETERGDGGFGSTGVSKNEG